MTRQPPSKETKVLLLGSEAEAVAPKLELADSHHLAFRRRGVRNLRGVRTR